MPIYEIRNRYLPEWVPFNLKRNHAGRRWEYEHYNSLLETSYKWNVEVIDDNTIAYSSRFTLQTPNPDAITKRSSGVLKREQITPFVLLFGPLLLWRPK